MRWRNRTIYRPKVWPTLPQGASVSALSHGKTSAIGQIADIKPTTQNFGIA